MTYTGKALALPIIFVSSLLLGVSSLLEGEIGLAVFWIFVAIGTIPEKNLSSRMRTVKYLAVILLGVLGLFFLEMKLLIRVLMVIALLAFAIELYRHIRRTSMR